ncbi:MAG: hypothetical protein QW641_01715 [Candidatus Aenigmatarchaeota archaeon]
MIMKVRKILISLFLIFPFSFADVASLFNSVDVSITGLVYFENKLSFDLELRNLENFVLTNQRIVIDIVEGCGEPTYPSQLSDCDNIIDEFVVDDIVLLPYGKIVKKIEKYIILAKGNYRVDVYISDPIAPSLGIHYIFSPGKYKSFFVENEFQKTKVKILRTKTSFNNYKGPIGFPAQPDSIINAKIYFESNNDFNGYLDVLICKWDDVNCLLTGTSEFSTKIPFKLKTGANFIDFNFRAPKKPDAYSILLRVFDEAGNIYSIYRSRVVVLGETAKIRKILIDKLPLVKNDEFSIFVKIGTSPDHYTKPVITNINVKISLLDEKRNIIKEWKKVIEKLSSNDNILYNIIEIKDKIDKNINKFYVCADIGYENYCLFYDFSQYENDYLIQLVDWNKEEVVLKIQTSSYLKRPIYLDVKDNNNNLIFSRQEFISKEYLLKIPTKSFRIFVVLKDLSSGFAKTFEFSKNLIDLNTFSTILLIVIIILTFVFGIILYMKKISKPALPLLLILFLISFSFSIPIWDDAEIKRIGWNRYNFTIFWNDSINGTGFINASSVILETNITGILSNYTIDGNNTYGIYWKSVERGFGVTSFTYKWYAKNLIEEWNSTPYFSYSLFDSDMDGVPNNIDKCSTPNSWLCNVYNNLIDPNTGCPFKPVKEFVIYGDFSSSCPYSSIPIYANFSECLNEDDKKSINGTIFLNDSSTYILNENCNLYYGTEGWLCFDRHCCEAYVGGNVQQGSYNLIVNYTLKGINFSQLVKPFSILNRCDTSATCSHGGHIREQPTLEFLNNCLYLNGKYYCRLGESISFKISSTVTEECNNGVTAQVYPGTLVWIYKGKIPVGLLHNNYAGCPPPSYIYSRDREYLINESRTSGFLWACDLNWRSGGQQVTNSYTFNEIGEYNVYVDYINAVCDSPDYICPNSIEGNPCRIGYIGVDSKGFEPLASYSVVVYLPLIIFKDFSLYVKDNQLFINADIKYFDYINGEYFYSNSTLQCWLNCNPKYEDCSLAQTCTSKVGSVCTIYDPYFILDVECSGNKCISIYNKIVCRVEDGLDSRINNITEYKFRPFDLDLIVQKDIISTIGKILLPIKVINKGIVLDSLNISWKKVSGNVELMLSKNFSKELKPNEFDEITSQLFIPFSADAEIEVKALFKTNNNVYAFERVKIKYVQVSLSDYGIFGIAQILIISILILWRKRKR